MSLIASNSKAQYRALGLTDSEYKKICGLLDREPNELELAVFSLMWSEHCAYKHSKKLLEKLPTSGEKVVMGPGENAGAVDVGDGQVVAFKVESHNHPSAIEPFQGAATGVGGILRDIFAVGAKPIAILDSLRFGDPRTERTRYLLDGVVAGIGHYGNSHGTPTVAGEIYFEPAYEHNCLVNAMCVGLVDSGGLVRSAAAGPGNLVILLGATTGRDGIGGASVLASAELEEDDDKRPTVQIGDPFEEKKLTLCCLELLEEGLLVALQDLGAAGLTSSSSEMASKGEVGIELDLSRIPLREENMEPFEIMISESQERMLCVVEPEKLEDVLALCKRWETRATQIGQVTSDRKLRVLYGGKEVGDMPVSALVDDCPLYDLESRKPSDPLEHYRQPDAVLTGDSSPTESLMALLGSANIADRSAVFEQYDSIVQSRTALGPGQADAAVLKLNEQGKSVAVSIDCNGRRVACDPYLGTIEAVVECAANLACVGAQPIGMTNCLNFGNPEKAHIAWQLESSVTGMADACRALSVPVVGGNVSLYNEGPDGPIYPTPVVGMVGEIPAGSNIAQYAFAHEGDWIALIGPFAASLKGSELARLNGMVEAGLPDIDLAAQEYTIRLVREAVRSGLVRGAHDISDGGLAVCASECAIAGQMGCDLDIEPLVQREQVSAEVALFGEAAGGILVSGERKNLLRLSMDAAGIGFLALGTVGGAQIKISCDTATIDVSVKDAEGVFQETISDLLR